MAIPASIETETAPVPSEKTLPKNSHSMWDAFEHILLFISLYVFATSFALLLHYFVDRWSPGSESYYSYDSFSKTLIRGYLSAIIVSYPLFSFFFLRITKSTINDPSLRTIKARKTLIYLTLVITFIISLANFISIVYNFLGGNVSLNFLLHFLVTFFVSGIIFLYYLKEVKEDRKMYA